MGDITNWIPMNLSEPSGNDTFGSGSKTNTLRQLTSDNVITILKCASLLLIGLVGAFGNTLTLIAIRKTPRLWTRSNMLLAALTAIHLYLCVIQAPYFVIFNLWVYVFADNSCYYRRAIAVIYPIPKATNHTIYFHFIAIAIDRFVAITYPLHYETTMTTTVITLMIVGSYIGGLTIMAIYLSYLRFVDWSTCGIPYSTVMTAVLDGGMYLAVALVTVVVYGRILLIARKHRSKMSSEVSGHGMSNRVQAIPEPSSSDPPTLSGGATGKPKIRKPVKEFKAANMTAVLVCVYTLPLLPYEIGRIMQACGNTQSYTSKLIDVGGSLGNINAGFDWIIYGIMNRSFRRAFMKILKIKSNEVSAQ